MASLPCELKQATEMFIEYEKLVKVRKSRYLNKFIGAHHAINNYLKANPESPHKEYSLRTKAIYTRSFLRYSSDVEVDFINWMRVCYLLTSLEEMRPFLEADSSLQCDYDEFISRYVDERLVSEFIKDEHNGKFKNVPQLSALFKMWESRREMRTVC